MGRIVAWVACAAVAAGGAWAACGRWLPLARSNDAVGVLPGLHVGGEPIAPGESARAKVESGARALGERRVRLVVDDAAGVKQVAEASLTELGVRVDVEAVTDRALRLGRTGDLLSRAKLADRARRGEIDVPLSPVVDPRAAFARIAALKEDLDTPPVSARLDLDRHTVVEEKNGSYLDVDGAIAAIARAATDPSIVEVRLPFVSVPPRATRESLVRIDIRRVIASFETWFSRGGDQGPRARNIEVAASHLDGIVIGPGQTVSFNEVVGARSRDNGFQTAFEIFEGEMVEGTGGGTCQVASTLHAIAFFGGLDIVQRLPHSRPSAYIQAGLDATVVYPTVDLKIQNPFSFPVVVHAKVDRNKISMELLGADKPVDVTFGHTVLSTTPFERKVVEDRTLDKPKRKQKGIDGMDLLRSRVEAWRDGRRKVESSHDTYPPTFEIWLVPPGFDASALPALGQDPSI